MKKYLILVALLIIIVLPNIGYANSAEPYYLPDHQGALYFKDESEISLNNETIQVIIADIKQKEVEYKIDYNMMGSNKKISTEMYFILPDTQNYSVLINGADVTNTTTKDILPKVENWRPKFNSKLIEPTSNKELGLYNYEIEEFNENDIYGVVIPIHFQPNEKINLSIKYKTFSGKYRGDDVKKVIFSLVYYMTPAKFWKGEPTVSYSIKFPKNSKVKFNSNLIMNKFSNNEYEGKLNTLPDKEWVITYVDMGNLIFGSNLSRIHNLYIFIVFIVLVSISIILSAKMRKIFILVYGYIIANIFWCVFLGSLGYGLKTLIGYLFLILYLWVFVPFVFYLLYKSKGKGYN